MSEVTDPGEVDGTNKIRAAVAGIRSICQELTVLSDAFYQTGNTKVSDDLGHLADNCTQICELIKQGLSDNAQVTMQRANESSHNMLMAAFAMAGVDLSDSSKNVVDTGN